jgi:hypothetical protein
MIPYRSLGVRLARIDGLRKVSPEGKNAQTSSPFIVHANLPSSGFLLQTSPDRCTKLLAQIHHLGPAPHRVTSPQAFTRVLRSNIASSGEATHNPQPAMDDRHIKAEPGLRDHSNDDTQMVDPKPSYKSWKKKYRKMRLQFDQRMQHSEELHREEQNALRTAKRLAIENELAGPLFICGRPSVYTDGILQDCED